MRNSTLEEDEVLTADLRAPVPAEHRVPPASEPKDDTISKKLLSAIVSQLFDDKAEDLVQIDLQGKSSFGDYMVVCSGRSTRQVAAMSEKLVTTIKQDFGIVSRVEGKDQADWILIDTGDVIVHIFRPEVREFYQLEKLWLAPEPSSP